MMEFEEFGRSGTAPNKLSKGTIPSQRVRPKTRGVASGVGATELADLNMSLKMDKGNNSGSGGHYDVSDDPIEDFQSAVESWERARRSRHNTDGDTPRGTGSSRTSNSAYTKSDPVSAAYSSQFRTTRTSSSKGSPRASGSSKSRAVAELHAAYGIGDSSSRGFSGSSSTNPRPGKSTTTNTSSRRRSGTASTASDTTNSRPSSRGSLRSSTASSARRKDVTSTHAPPSVSCCTDRSDSSSGGITTTAQNRSVGGKASPKVSRSGLTTTSTIQRPPLDSPTTTAATSSAAATASVTASVIANSEAVEGTSLQKPSPSYAVAACSKHAHETSSPGSSTGWYAAPSPPRTGQSPSSTSPHTSGTESTFRRRQEHLYRVSSAGHAAAGRPSTPQREDSARDSVNHSTNDLSGASTALAASLVSAVARGTGKGGDRSCSPLEVDVDGEGLAESGYAMNTSAFSDGEIPRPQSRKLYLGSARTPVSATSRPTEVQDGGGGGGAMRAAPRSGGELPRHHLSPDLGGLVGGPGGETGSDVKIVEGRHPSSGDGFVSSSKRWKDASVDYDNRPPSRQRSAFPTHLADVDSAMSNKGSREKKHIAADIVASDRDHTSPRDGTHIAAGTATGAGSSPRSTRGSALTGAGEYNDRPPSRQKICAQNLFDTESGPGVDIVDNTLTDSVLEVVKPEPMRIVMRVASPHLSPTDSSISLGIIDIGDAADSIGTSPPPRAPRTAFDSSSLGPMNDPTADGFTQLDRSTTAPFKIRVRIYAA